MKASALVLLFGLILGCSSQSNFFSYLSSGLNYGPSRPAAPVSASDIFNDVDTYNRNNYWNYLIDAVVVYQAHIDSDVQFLFFIIYKNYIGTFFSVSTYQRSSARIAVNTFTRLGDGFAPSDPQVYEKITITPFVVSLDLGAGQYHAPQPKGSFNFTEQYARQYAFKSQSTYDEVGVRCGSVDAFIRKNYWYYLNGAVAIGSSLSAANQRCYCAYTYVNIVGTFLVLGSWDYQKNAPTVNTFVRIGEGYAPGNVQKCYPMPSLGNWGYTFQ